MGRTAVTCKTPRSNRANLESPPASSKLPGSSNSKRSAPKCETALVRQRVIGAMNSSEGVSSMETRAKATVARSTSTEAAGAATMWQASSALGMRKFSRITRIDGCHLAKSWRWRSNPSSQKCCNVKLPRARSHAVRNSGASVRETAGSSPASLADLAKACISRGPRTSAIALCSLVSSAARSSGSPMPSSQTTARLWARRLERD